MNTKMIALAAIGLGAISLSAEEAASAANASNGTSISLSSSFGYESKYVNRGIQLADGIYTPAVDISYGNFYAGAWFAFTEDSVDSYPTEADLYAGYNIALSEIVTIDMGVTRYAYDRVFSDFFRSGNFGNSVEFYTGASANILLSPSVYAYYDIDLHNLTFEAKIGHSFNFGDKVSLNLGASAGYVIGTAGDDFYNTAIDGVHCDNNYAYAGATADLAYNFTEKTSASIGARYSVSDFDSFYGSYHDIYERKDALWFGVSFSTGF